jgi:DNA-binding beta-propeller fold protein YncE
MKKIVMFAILLMLFSISIQFNTIASSQATYGVPYQTYTLNAEGRYVPTQSAYIPVGHFGSSLGLKNPEDLFVLDDIFYIADTGNKRIVMSSLEGLLLDSVISPEFQQPTGVFVKEGFIYVADKAAKKVFKIDLADDSIVQTIEKPTSPIFGQKNDFVPTKVVVDSSDSIYIVGEGSTSGIIQVNYAGEFVGYLGINTVSLTLRRILYNLFVRDSELASSLPASPTNVALGLKGSILTTNVNVRETFKRLNISGINTLSQNTSYPTSQLSDIWMNHENYIYLVSENGDVFEYDENGNLLFFFNTKDTSQTKSLGLSNTPKGIATDELGNLYILDRGYNAIHVYQRTVFVDLVHQAVTLYNDGRYMESKPLWEEIIRQNSSFALAHSALGSALLKQGDFEAALSEFFDAKDYQGYSDAFWEIRNVQLQQNLSTWMIVLIVLWVVYVLGKKVFIQSSLHASYVAWRQGILNKKLIKEVTLSLHAIKQPFDMFFDIKRYNRASVKSGFIVFGLFVLVYLINTYATGFLFRNPNPNNLLIELVIVIAGFFLYVLVNYLVSTLNDGEGRLKDVFIATSYVLIPFIIFTLPMTFLSHFLTYNEAFIFDFYHQIIFGWTLLLIVLSIKGIHNYTFLETVKNIIIIIFGMFILVLIGLLIYSFMGQLIEFVLSVIKEVIYRV